MEQERRSVGCLVAVARMGETHVQIAVDQVGIDHVVESYLVRQLIRSAAMSAFSTNSGKEIYDAESIETGNYQDFACGRHSAWDWRINCDGDFVDVAWRVHDVQGIWHEELSVHPV